jgi:hypothetical protein
MCDIYYAECAEPSCKRKIYMHLDDFNTWRSDVRVYCPEHIPKDRSRGVLWEILEDDTGETGLFAAVLITDYDGPWPALVFVEALSEEAVENSNGNHPNACELRSVEAFGFPLCKEYGK